MVPINYWAVLVSAIASMVIGSIWYGPLFGKMWMGLVGLTPEKVAGAKAKGMTASYLVMAVGSLVMAFVLAHSIVFGASYLQISGLNAGLQGAFWSWLGFIAPITLGSVLWEGRSWKLWFVNNGYYLLTLLVMGAILAVWI